MSELTSNELNALISLLDDTDLDVRNHVKDRILSLGIDVISIQLFKRKLKNWFMIFNFLN
jgi:hypothetical protein